MPRNLKYFEEKNTKKNAKLKWREKCMPQKFRALCRSAADQLNVLIRLRNLFGFQEKTVLVSTIAFST